MSNEDIKNKNKEAKLEEMTKKIEGITDIIGMYPEVGEAVEIVKGVMELTEGKYSEAAISLVETIPFLGELEDSLVDLLKKLPEDTPNKMLDICDKFLDLCNMPSRNLDKIKNGATCLIEDIFDEFLNGSKKVLNGDELFDGKNIDEIFDAIKDSFKEKNSSVDTSTLKLSNLTEIEKLEIANKYKEIAPISIPDSARINAKTMNAGYEQITYKWSDSQFKYEVRWHTRTPGAPADQGNTWVIQRTIPGNGGDKPQSFFKIGDDEWIEAYKWYDAINARKSGNATQKQTEILDKGHWKE